MATDRAARLSGVDVFHVRVHQEMRWRGLAGNGCTLALGLAGRVDEQLLEQRLTAARAQLPELRWQLSRDLRLQPVWRASGALRTPWLQIRSLESQPSVLDAVTGLLDEPAGGRQPFSVVVLHGKQTDWVVLRWFHPAADARGGQRLLQWLGAGTGPELPPAPAAAERFASADDRFEALSRRERWQLLGAYREHVLSLTERPIVSLDTAAGRVRPGRTRAVRRRLDLEQSAAFIAVARRRAGLAETSLLAYGAARLVDGALRARGLSPERHTLVVPLSLDKKRGCQRMFGNNLTMMMLTVDGSELGDRSGALAALAQQRRSIVRERMDLAMLVGLDTARYLPAPVYSWFSRRPFAGERMSALVTDPGEVDIDSFMGVPVEDAMMIPSAVLPPGIQLVASRHGKRLSLTVVFVDSVIGPDEVERRLDDLVGDLLADD